MVAYHLKRNTKDISVMISVIKRRLFNKGLELHLPICVTLGF